MTRDTITQAGVGDFDEPSLTRAVKVWVEEKFLNSGSFPRGHRRSHKLSARGFAHSRKSWGGGVNRALETPDFILKFGVILVISFGIENTVEL